MKADLTDLDRLKVTLSKTMGLDAENESDSGEEDLNDDESMDDEEGEEE